MRGNFATVTEKKKMMKTYLEIHVPIKYDARWFDELRFKMSDTNVRWQNGHYHITMAFCDETPDADLRSVLQKHLGNAVSPVLCFDKLDVFESNTGMFIIHLGVTNIPTEFSALVEDIRNALKDKGCVMLSDFKLHVTLGRLKDSSLDISVIKKIIETVSLPVFSLSLTEIEYKEFGTRHTIYETKLKK